MIAELPVGTLLRQTGACVHSDDGITHDPWCQVDWNGTKGWASSSGLARGGVPQEPSTPSTGDIGKDGYNKGLEAADRLLGPNSITFGVRAR